MRVCQKLLKLLFHLDCCVEGESTILKPQSGLNWDIKRTPILRRSKFKQEAGPRWTRFQHRGKIKVPPSILSNLLPHCIFIRWIDYGSAAFTSHRRDNDLLVVVKNYCRSCSSISVRSINSIFWQIEVALIRKLRFHSFEGEMWSDTSKGFLGWVELGRGLDCEKRGECISLRKKGKARLTWKQRWSACCQLLTTDTSHFEKLLKGRSDRVKDSST